MELPVQSFTGMVEQMAASLQGKSIQFIDLTAGSVLRALLEASASVALWLQWLIVQTLSSTRAATSEGADLDSWMADFSLYRMPGQNANGSATFSRYTTGISATIAVDTIVATQDGAIQFAVVPSTSHPAWNGVNGYLLQASLTSVDVPIKAMVPGISGNVLPGTIALMQSPIPGVDLVTNNTGTAGGNDQETDEALRQRFVLYINSRSLATRNAIMFAVSSIQFVTRFSVLENCAADFSYQIGNFCVIADDGTGSPASTLLDSVQAAVDSVRPIGVTFAVRGPVSFDTRVSISIATNGGSSHSDIAVKIQDAVFAWIIGLPIGGRLALSKLDAIAHDVDPGVTSVLSASINGFSQDLILPEYGVIVPLSVVVI